ncbi:MAG: hypothetical protein C4K60_06235 [Ideonella sp. MAG2]|nr:MAG: hypothetical protein C4K60_06235 [Ideonella sp. MAG2]
MLRLIVCLMLCLSLPSQSAWAAWRMAAAPVAQSEAPMPCHPAADSKAAADDSATTSPQASASTTCPHCGTCAACLLAHALPGTPTAALNAPPLAQVTPPQADSGPIAEFTTSGPDRPPRAS